MVATVIVVQQHEDAWCRMAYDVEARVVQDPLNLAYFIQTVLTNGRVLDHARTDDLIDAPEVPEDPAVHFGQWVRGNLVSPPPVQEPPA